MTKGYIITRKAFSNSESIKDYLVSHCRIALWKRERKEAKIFDDMEAVNNCIKFWKLNNIEIESIELTNIES
jgi:hypothetical protein